MTKALIYTVFRFTSLGWVASNGQQEGMGQRVEWSTYSVAATSSQEAEQIFRTNLPLVWGRTSKDSRFFINVDHDHLFGVQANSTICAGELSVEEVNRWIKIHTKDHREDGELIKAMFREMK